MPVQMDRLSGDYSAENPVSLQGQQNIPRAARERRDTTYNGARHANFPLLFVSVARNRNPCYCAMIILIIARNRPAAEMRQRTNIILCNQTKWCDISVAQTRTCACDCARNTWHAGWRLRTGKRMSACARVRLLARLSCVANHHCPGAKNNKSITHA